VLEAHVLREGIRPGKGFITLCARSDDKRDVWTTRLAWSGTYKRLLARVRTDVRDERKTRCLRESTAVACGPFTGVV